MALLKKKMPHKHYLDKLHLQATKNEQISSHNHLNMKAKNAPSSFFSWRTLHEKKNTKRKDLSKRYFNKTWI